MRKGAPTSDSHTHTHTTHAPTPYTASPITRLLTPLSLERPVSLGIQSRVGWPKSVIRSSYTGLYPQIYVLLRIIWGQSPLYTVLTALWSSTARPSSAAWMASAAILPESTAPSMLAR